MCACVWCRINLNPLTHNMIEIRFGPLYLRNGPYAPHSQKRNKFVSPKKTTTKQNDLLMREKTFSLLSFEVFFRLIYKFHYLSRVFFCLRRCLNWDLVFFLLRFIVFQFRIKEYHLRNLNKPFKKNWEANPIFTKSEEIISNTRTINCTIRERQRQQRQRATAIK